MLLLWGVRRVNPQAEVNVRWLQNCWYDPQGAKEATEALIAEGIKCLKLY